MSENPHQAMNACLRAVWQRTQRKHAIGGLLAFARWFVPLFLIAILIDRFAYFPGWLRGLVGLAMLIAALRQAWRHGGSQLQAFDAIRIAKQIEQSKGGMDSLLVTAVHFQQQGAAPGTSAEMWEFAQRQAELAAKDIHASTVVTMTDLQRPLRIAMGVAAVVLLASILHGSFLIAGLGRLFTPWQTIAYPTKTKIDLGSDELVVKEGAPATLEVRLSGSVPKTARLELQTGKGRPRELALEVNQGLCTYEISSASRDFSYRIKAGDARSEWRQVRVIPAPRMTKVKVQLDFPDYIDRGNEQLEALTLTVPEGTKVRWQLTLDTPIRKATLHRDGIDDLPLEIGSDGRTLTLEESASASRGYSFSWTEDRHGFDFESPRYFLQVASDQAPRVELTAPASNLSAMLNRPLQFAVRTQDDHGIGTSTITYRVNLRPEKTITIDPPLGNGEGEQKIAWDYRKEITDLQVGDTVSFVIEVTDKYPGENGAHRVRTDSRRITFLSREDYLAEVTKQMEKLLNRVRTLYRQERAAHELVIGLDPAAESFVPTCQLEAIRQEMVREQLLTTATEVQTLLDDLAANQVSDAVESEALTTAQNTLRAIAADQVARAADLLRAQVGAKVRDPRLATEAVNQAARELSKLVLLRGIDASREVFARETHVIANDLARLRQRLLTAAPDQAETLAQDHEKMAAWTGDLLDKLSAAMHYDKRPLAVLGLNRRIHGLRTRGLTNGINEVAALAKAGKLNEAAAAQYPLIRPLLESEFTMRVGSEYALIGSLREQLSLIIAEQQQVHDASSGENFDQQASDLARRQSALRDRLILAPLPGIPAARPKLSDLQLPAAPATDELRLKAETLMSEAATHLKAKAEPQAIASQSETITTLKQLDTILIRWSDELAQKSIGASSQVSDATDRVDVLQKLETRQVVLLEQTEEAALDEKKPKSLLDDQEAIAGELESFARELSGGTSGTPKNLLPLVGRIGSTIKTIKLATDALRANRIEDALKPQEQAATAIGEARLLAQEQLSRLNLLQQLIGFEQAVAAATNGMADIVGGQNDLIAATKVADKKTLPTLLAPQGNLHQCLSDIAPSLDLVAARLDVGTPLVFAASDVEDALTAMKDGDAEDAAELQTIAIESLTKVKNLVGDVSVQTGYVAEVVEALQSAQSEASMLAFRQRQVREDTAPENRPALQLTLSSDTTAYGRAITDVAGKVDPAKISEAVISKLGEADLTLDFNLPATRMAEALQLLKSNQPAADAMLAAEKSLDSSSSQLNLIISMLNGLPSITLTKSSPPELHRLIAILDVASKHRGLLRHTQAADAKEMTAITGEQQKLSQAISKAAPIELSHPLLTAAMDRMLEAGNAFATSKPADALRAQLSADQSLRHFIIEQALILNTAPVPPSSSDSDVLVEAETDDLYYSESTGFLSDFVSGEAPKEKKSEWEILGNRNRAALNQNFARELPLEFRATLKNYYERVAK